MRRLVVLAAAATLLAGCGTSDDARQAEQVVARFYEAVRHDRGAEACAQLSTATAEQLESQSGQSCDSVIGRLDYAGGAIVSARVFMTSAKVDLRTGESAFLDREPEGWRISALACRPEKGKPRDRPFECEVEG